jgi:hypothetical protein
MPAHHNPHTTQKIGEMVIVAVVVLLLGAAAVFVTQRYQKPAAASAVPAEVQVQAQTAIINAENHQQFQQVTAPPGTVVTGFPSVLVPVHGQVVSSYHNQYNGFDQYTLNLTVNVSMANEYAALQSFLTKGKFKVTQKTSSSAQDMINATQGADYVTVQLLPTNSSNTQVAINYGTPLK